MDCRTDKWCSLKKNLVFKLHDVISTKEQTVINSIKDAFEGEDMQTQYSVLSYRIDLYFHKYKLAIEVDELGHNDRNIDYEIQRQQALEREISGVFIRINPDATDFSIFKVLGYRIDLYFHKYKLAIEVDELGHNDRNIDYEIQRQRAIEKELGCVFIRINPDEKDFNIFKEINKIYRHITQS